MNSLVISAKEHETRVALIENNDLVELYIERKSERGLVGNIYKGKVVRVLPAMQAAFVNIGLSRTAFLYIRDVYEDLDDIDMEGAEEKTEKPKYKDKRYPKGKIEDLLKEGQEVLVQVSKDPIANKGARITTHISIPGRHLVLVPMMNRVGVSKKIEMRAERERLRELVSQFVKDNKLGVIIRTVSANLKAQDLKADLHYLYETWKNIIKAKEAKHSPALLYEEIDLSLRAVRDLATSEIDTIVIDSKEAHKELVNFTKKFIPSITSKIELFTKKESIFKSIGIDIDIEKSFNRKVWLKSGGYIVIDTTEALTAIDVNSGKHVGKGNFEDAIVKVNLEAVKEVTYQLRLRNIGGIIVVDFIDMMKEANRKKVYRAFTDALEKDKARTTALPISEFGLLQLTRKRTRENLLQTLTDRCFYCHGTGFLKSKITIAYEIIEEVEDELMQKEIKEVRIEANWEIADILNNKENYIIKNLVEKYKKMSLLVPVPTFILKIMR